MRKADPVGGKYSDKGPCPIFSLNFKRVYITFMTSILCAPVAHSV